MLAEMGAKNGWSGIIINGCCRDSEEIGKLDIGVKTIGSNRVFSAGSQCYIQAWKSLCIWDW